jgi:CelD/BcsL family acetyltransferase involved in cellulose biosynthesis
LVVAVHSEQGELAGVLPLCREPGSRPPSIRFAGWRFGDHFGIVAAPGDAAMVAEAAMPALQAEVHRALVILHRVDRDGDWPERMAAAGRGLRVVTGADDELPHVPVAGLDWEGYLAQRSVKFRQRVARGLEKALDKAGINHVVRETSDEAALDEDMETLFRLHDLRRTESSVGDPAVRRALTEFARGALRRGWLRLRILELDGSPASAYLAWHVGGRYSVYQSGFDPAWTEQSAGTVLLNDTVRSAIGEGAEVVDLLLGGEAYKWRFAPEPRRVRTVAVVGAVRPARLLVSAEAFGRRHARGVLDRPGIGRAARWVAGKLPGQ